MQPNHLNFFLISFYFRFHDNAAKLYIKIKVDDPRNPIVSDKKIYKAGHEY